MPKSTLSRNQHGESTGSTHHRLVDEDGEREMTLKDRQEAMNQSHPFGLPLWKPALYKKSRSIVRSANLALHSVPSSAPELFLNPGNILWCLLFGWWLSLIVCISAVVMTVLSFGLGRQYSRVLIELASYLLWPFGRYVEMSTGYPTSNETIGLISGQTKSSSIGLLDILYYLVFFIMIAPFLFLVSALCWLCVISIPMAKLNYILIRHLYQHPLSLRFKSTPSGLLMTHEPTSAILLCTYQAIGLQYYKYTYDGINILFINLMPLVFFVILDDWFFKNHLDGWITSPSLIFFLSLASVIPLSYFIGMGVSSISAQSSMGVGAVINATFGSIIEIILYAVALISGKSNLVEGALIGSFLAGVLLMPGCSMVSGAVRRKEQRFNAKSAGVTSTMLIMAIIGALTPTLFYQLYGSFELKCVECPQIQNGTLACSKCYYDQLNPTHDPVYQNSVKPLMWLCAAILPSAYIIGLVFSLHTHVDMVWKNKSKPTLTYYQRLMPTHLISQLIHPQTSSIKTHITPVQIQPNLEEIEEDEEEHGSGHDSPNWSKGKSFVILFGCTLLYSMIAEILVDTVDEVMKDFPMDEKFLGLTLFALVPNITEFMNAISFAMYGNIVLSMEIGSAYALQVCLLQIPAMVAFSVWYNYGKEELAQFTFSLVFPRWDVISVIFSVFLLTYTYQEGKANYFKGSILILSYIVLVAGFYFIPPFSEHSVLSPPI
ncbi:Sodium/calcium exchanger protein-domain-containing protein [Blakeslea trispora]|nr:Sodium/calcium exchanger protein-domain-containing protein [Blakeslea trispora]